MTKKTMAIVSVFMVVAMTAVGFAAWLIVGTVDDQTTGSFVSNELQDKYFKVEVEFVQANESDQNGNIIFGAPTTGSSKAGDWLTYKDDDAKENLTAVATIKFIPDAGFSKVTGQEKQMDFYLLDSEVKDSEGTVTSKTYRTVRVQIDIAEVFADGEQTSNNHQWFDMAVQLGYIQYPTAHLLEKVESAEGDSQTEVTYKTYAESKQLTWGTDVENSDGIDYNNFADGYLYLDLTYDMFEIQYPADSDLATEATAQIKIDFNWGSAVSTSEQVTEENETVYTYHNPYPFFNSFTPESAVKVTKYLGNTDGVLQLLDTKVYDDEETADVIEGYTNEDAQTIRYKDLAQRMLYYLANYINYAPAEYDSAGQETKAATGIQFSLTLLEGTAQVVDLTTGSN